MGGEKKLKYGKINLEVGSPPRGRGKGITARPKGLSGRITPAWAGKSRCARLDAGHRRDHPRVGGEKFRGVHMSIFSIGSPPRGRGKALTRPRRPRLAGITPAWAGKSSTIPPTWAATEDHPRVGGEKGVKHIQTEPEQGSPPRGRGKGLVHQQPEAALGITPAWAGKRLKRSHRSGIFISGPIPFHSVLHRPAGSGGSRAGRDGSPAGQPQNTGPA